MSRETDIDTAKWIQSWELQQNSHIRRREERFQFMFDLVERSCGNDARILDLACGPGSLSGRFLQRFAEATSIAVDFDPVLLHLARNSDRYDKERLSFVEADISSADWTHKLNEDNFDAVLSTTALHWLPESSLRKLYSDIYFLLRSGGIFLNGDHLYPENEPSGVKDLFAEIRHNYEEVQFASGEALKWGDWWRTLAEEPSLASLFSERKKRYPDSESHDHPIPLEAHVKFLHETGFKEVYVGWQDLDNRVLIAIKQ